MTFVHSAQETNLKARSWRHEPLLRLQKPLSAPLEFADPSRRFALRALPALRALSRPEPDARFAERVRGRRDGACALIAGVLMVTALPGRV